MGKRNHLKEKQRSVLYSVLAIVICCIFLFPLYWIIVSSFKIDGEIFANPPTLWPRQFTLAAYQEQLKTIALPLRNSVTIAGVSMIISSCLSIPAAYGLARYRVPGKRSILVTFLVTQMLPASLVLTPLYLIFARIHLINNLLAPILATATVTIPFNILMLRPAFLSCPRELEDAAKIDGCNTLTCFLRIIVPISKSGIITAGAFGFIMSWNDLVYSMTFNTQEELRPMTTSIYTFMNQYGTQWNQIMAYGVLLILPVTIVFLSLQKHIVSGLVSGSVKG
jgi:ABC-type sugar transport system, permease component